MGPEGIRFPHSGLFVTLFGDDVYLVGGVVRDMIISGSIGTRKDIDLMVTGYEYSELEDALRKHGKINTVGKSFAVLKFTKENITFDISVPRRDRKRDTASASHRNFSVESGRAVSLEEDLGRRDFSCNSIAVRLSDGKVFDPFDGIGAIRQKKIVMTGPESFSDDPLRLLRAARFASVLGFDIEEAIYLAAKEIVLDELSPERVSEELFRLLLESERPSRGIYEYLKLTILEKLFPAVYDMSLTIQDSEFHPETDEFGHHTVFAHVLIALDVGKKLSVLKRTGEEARLALLLSILLHDIGKPLTTKWEYKRGRMTVTSVRHDSVGYALAGSVLEKLKIETRLKFPLRDAVMRLVKNHHRIFDLYNNREETGFKAFSRLLRDMDGMDDLLVFLDFADRQSRLRDPLAFKDLDEISGWYFNRKEELRITEETIQPVIQGRDLIKAGIRPGPEMGEYLKKLYEMQLDGAFSTVEEGLAVFDMIRDEN